MIATAPTGRGVAGGTDAQGGGPVCGGFPRCGPIRIRAADVMTVTQDLKSYARRRKAGLRISDNT
ncbi:hypothetical protein GCM10010431_41950 [Streptomyces kunmingensis]